jgi:hypothetical protein
MYLPVFIAGYLLYGRSCVLSANGFFEIADGEKTATSCLYCISTLLKEES